MKFDQMSFVENDFFKNQSNKKTNSIIDFLK